MADNLPSSCADVTKSGNLNFLETSGPVQACNGTALHLPLQKYEHVRNFGYVHAQENMIEHLHLPFEIYINFRNVLVLTQQHEYFLIGPRRLFVRRSVFK